MPLHGIRHSNATFLLSTGTPDKDVAKRLGYMPEVLERVYTYSNEEDDKKLVAEIERVTTVAINYLSNKFESVLNFSSILKNYENTS